MPRSRLGGVSAGGGAGAGGGECGGGAGCGGGGIAACAGVLPSAFGARWESVVRKRRSKMNKHKHRKWRKKMRNLGARNLKGG